jgi:hypothetical protein
MRGGSHTCQGVGDRHACAADRGAWGLARRGLLEVVPQLFDGRTTGRCPAQLIAAWF